MKKDKARQLNKDYAFSYSTNSGYNPFEKLTQFFDKQDLDGETLNVAELHFEVKGRNGKPVTILKNLPKQIDIQDLASQLKKFLNTGGSVKDDYIILQGGDRRKEIANWLVQKGIKSKRVGG